MHSALAAAVDLDRSWASITRGVCVGRIVRITEEGQPLVDFSGNRMGPLKARTVINVPVCCLDGNEEIDSVLIVFENQDPTLPIIVGIIRDKLYSSHLQQEVTLSEERPSDVLLDGRRIEFDAKEEIVLRCGKSSVTLRKDGKIVVKGVHIVSRASEINKIKGGSVAIN